ncbi:MAG: type I restriction endonuclease subunit R, partial [Cyanobacteria bacterium J06629_2]
DYKSKYLDIYDKTRAKDDDREPESMIDEVDFELELIQRDDINVAYILKLLADLQRDVSDESQAEDYQQKKASILELLDKEVQLRSKRNLIEKFIDIEMPTLEPEAHVEQIFKNFWNQERVEAIRDLCRSENLSESAVNQMIANYKFSGKKPLRETVLSACNEKPKLLERKKIFKRVVSQLLDIINKFDDALGEFEESE